MARILLQPDDAVSELVLVPAGQVAQPTPLPVVNVFTAHANIICITPVRFLPP